MSPVKVALAVNPRTWGDLSSLSDDQSLHLAAIAHSGSDALEAVLFHRPDLLVIDLVLQDAYCFDVLHRLTDEVGVSPKVIVLADTHSQGALQAAMLAGADHVLAKPVHAQVLSNLIISEFHAARVSTGESTNRLLHVRQRLLRYGVPCHLDGWRYLVTALVGAMERQALLDAMGKELYPAVAERHQTTAVRVERSIRYAIVQAWSHGNAHLREMFGNRTHLRGRAPTNSEFLATVLDQLCIPSVH